MKTISSRSFNQNVSGAKRMAKDEPVVITDRGKPSYVLATYEEFERRCSRSAMSAVDLIADLRPEADFDFEVPRWGVELRTVKLD